MTECCDPEVQRTLGRIESKLEAVENKVDDVSKSQRKLSDRFTSFKLKHYLVSGISGGITGFLSTFTKP